VVKDLISKAEACRRESEELRREMQASFVGNVVLNAVGVVLEIVGREDLFREPLDA